MISTKQLTHLHRKLRQRDITRKFHQRLQSYKYAPSHPAMQRFWRRHGNQFPRIQLMTHTITRQRENSSTVIAVETTVAIFYDERTI